MSNLYSFDSIDKLEHYLAMIALEPVNGITPPKYLGISKLFWRDYTCPPACGGCCWNYTKDVFLFDYKESPLLSSFESRSYEINGKQLPLMTDYDGSKTKKRDFCKFLNRKDGRCEIYEVRPFSCRFELNKLMFNSKLNRVLLSKRLYGRGWQYNRIDGGKGALCEMVDVSLETIKRVKERDVPLIEKLVSIANKLQIKNKGDMLLEKLNFQYESLIVGSDIKHITLIEPGKRSLF